MIKRILLLLLVLPFMLTVRAASPDHSVLSSGKWYKVAVWQTGIHKITYENLVAAGMNLSGVRSSDLRLYGNGGGMLPELCGATRTSDLRENSISVADGGDGSFDPGDYIIFYGEGPDKWKMDKDTKLFSHEKNLYSDTSYYFVTADLGPGKRIGNAVSTTEPANYFSRRISDYAVHDLDVRNVIKSGKIWLGEEFNDTCSVLNLSYYFPNIDTNSGIRFSTYVVARSPVTSRFSLIVNDSLVDKIQVDFLDLANLTFYAKYKIKGSVFFYPTDTLKIRIEYDHPVYNALGWLNYLEMNFQRYLNWAGPQMRFRDVNSVSENRVTEYVVEDMHEGVTVWDVTDPGNILLIGDTITDSVLRFRMATDTTLHEFIAFDGSYFFPVRPEGEVINQDIRSLEPTDLVIVTNPLFLEQANRLAAFHQTENGTSATVVTTTDIYNEFASGRPDLTAIRDFMKMLWDRGNGSGPKYLLLFGDGSYDYKDRVPGNTNLVPTYQSMESLRFVGTYVTDDYFGLMGNNEGEECAGTLDVGIGRFPVTRPDQAKAIVDKILHYATHNDTILSPWKNRITFIADDEDSNLHVIQAEDLATIVTSKYPAFNIDKIYNDAYQLYDTPSGPRYPDVNKAINKAVSDGNLIINYTGHGGEDGWSGEKVLTTQDIESWTNSEKLPVFITATCEFSRFDNPERFSAGEMVIVKPGAGAIALYTTTRLALATSNFKLDTSFFTHLMDRDEAGNYLKMGDLIRISKNNNNNNNSIRNFVLLGDPAQNIAFPGNRVVTTAINGKPFTESPDTLMGRTLVNVEGEVQDGSGNRIEGYNGTLYSTVFDKYVTYQTMANQPKSYQQPFQVQNVVLADGKATVTDGRFSFTFVVPKDIIPQPGFGKLSYYATDKNTDASGYSQNVVIGGEDLSIGLVNPGPDISLYMDNRDFLNGGKTGTNPLLIADIYDTNGINNLGLGIGNEILGILDDDGTHPIVFNSYYTPDIDRYESGTVLYPMGDLTIGMHTMTVKAWDLFGNSSEKTIQFYVYESPSLNLSNVFNYPNPFAGNTSFSFEVSETEGSLEVEIIIYSMSGKAVRTLVADYAAVPGGRRQIPWDGTDQDGNRLASGIYPYRVIFKGSKGTYAETSQKLILMR